jgi:3-hydroxyisobutyrate dehydrogenase
MLKDLKALDAFHRRFGLDLPVIEAAIHRYADFVGAGNEMVDSAAIARLYERNSAAPA